MLLTEYNEAEAMELFKEDGRKEGRIEGRDEGSTKRLIDQVCKKLVKGKTIEIIADEVEEETKAIKPIIDIAVKYAPDYDVDAIYDELIKNK